MSGLPSIILLLPDGCKFGFSTWNTLFAIFTIRQNFTEPHFLN
ncbi:hypothetical protein DFA_07826 [Cavenderia fasciculata]|uniref:Uncharacterized protein n=1 Tax=Cavenderia fasciculata TaxID=261658 RepID=F4Q3H8_CACFS|nr:uncharacterized protein DFA_07826 [Cavenderia fasciculata]EGG16847.1 hypothetical protein DFA_07826 [Cavenderia fasciculata]|eukprot:XP_004355321.1 hypothetical protein DFA_07826 [Cavenderia fasciculata]